MYCEQSGNPRGVPVVFLHGGPGAGASAGAPPVLRPGASTASSSSTSAAPGRSTPLGVPRRQHDAAPGRGHRAAARAPRHRALAGVRRLVGLDARARLRRAPSRALPRARAARHLPLPPERDRLVPLRPAQRSFPRRGARSPGFIPEAERGDLLAAYYQRLDRSRSRGAHAGGARLERLRGLVLDAAAQPGAVADFAGDRVALGLARIEAHYFTHDIFLPREFLLDERRPRLQRSRR